ncbi:MAG: hypothetical protein B7Y12_08575 [Rhizobiales bacterium 24-66-13]|jgi:hypothetical protein|nr:MAG: hypothetical protein B7Y12_08575 [Rhizobiales bacterium 24-66-13]OZB06211.1 MAG: hypothetical protein B7X67_10720 [Rhizobiales bacterium 39-66-18]HQS48599.1 DUF3085 domain-containing protein [Xanthobacteraceae bacterium]
MFTFSLSEVRAVIARGQSDAAANGGFRDPHLGRAPAREEKPGLWLVGDQGVYILSNGKLAEGVRALVCYALECDPQTNPDWFHYKRHHYGGDDGVDFLDGENLLSLLDAHPGATHLRIEMTETNISLVPVRLQSRI